MSSEAGDPFAIDRVTYVAMRNMMEHALQVQRVSVEEACGRAWGYASARNPRLLTATIDAAISEACMELQILPPPRMTAEHEDGDLVEIDQRDMASHIAYMMTHSDTGKPLRGSTRDSVVHMAAWTLVQHLRRRGYYIMGKVRTRRGDSGVMVPD